MTDGVVDGQGISTPVGHEVPRRLRRRRTPGRWVTAAVVVIITGLLIHSAATNPRFQWSVVGHYLTAGSILAGLVRTLYLTFIAMAIGIVLGTVLALMRASANPLLRAGATVYSTVFRGTPVLVQLLFWFNIAALYPRLTIGLPSGPTFLGVGANSLITPLAAAILGLGLNEAAYMSEIVRAGIDSVDRGQSEAAMALGMPKLLIQRRIVLPQAMRLIIPPTGNETIGMLKYTAIVSVIGMPDLLYSAEAIYTRTFQTIPLLVVASIWYLLATSVLYVIQRQIERHFARPFAGAGRAPRRDLVARLARRRLTVPTAGDMG